MQFLEDYKSGNKSENEKPYPSRASTNKITVICVKSIGLLSETQDFFSDLSLLLPTTLSRGGGSVDPSTNS